MRITVTVDDEIFSEVKDITGLTAKSAVIRHALQSFVQREAAKQLALLGGRQPDLDYVPRRRSWSDAEA